MLATTSVSGQFITLAHPAWSQLLKGLRHDIYHTPEYMRIEAERLEATAEAFVIESKDQVFFVPYLVRRCEFDRGGSSDDATFDVVSAYGYPGPLMSDAAAAAEGFARDCFGQLAAQLRGRRVCTAFFRLHPILTPIGNELNLQDCSMTLTPTISVDLTQSEELIWARTRKGHQSTINKCKRLGLTSRFAPYQDHRDDFLAIYKETINLAGASEPYFFKESYFDSLMELGERVHLCIVEAKNEIAAACLFFESGGIVQAHLGGTRSRYRDQSPFSLLLHHARLWAKSRGNTFLHLGGGIGGAEDRVFSFKAGFARQRHAFGTLRLVTDQERYRRLVESCAKSRAIAASTLLQSSFFPAYRSPA